MRGSPVHSPHVRDGRWHSLQRSASHHAPGGRRPRHHRERRLSLPSSPSRGHCEAKETIARWPSLCRLVALLAMVGSRGLLGSTAAWRPQRSIEGFPLCLFAAMPFCVPSMGSIPTVRRAPCAPMQRRRQIVRQKRAIRWSNRGPSMQGACRRSTGATPRRAPNWRKPTLRPAAMTRRPRASST